MRVRANEVYRLLRFDPPVDMSPLTIWLVDGNSIRTDMEVDFIGGGHHFVYDFVPYNDVWIDIDTGDIDTIFYLIHELAERALMMRGMDYDSAHDRANQYELKVRNDPTKIDELLSQLAKRNRSMVSST